MNTVNKRNYKKTIASFIIKYNRFFIILSIFIGGSVIYQLILAFYPQATEYTLDTSVYQPLITTIFDTFFRILYGISLLCGE
ncbi:MAG: hypothetical protein JSV56_01410, partial [Methanomassiliicoccales archaeon]